MLLLVRVLIPSLVLTSVQTYGAVPSRIADSLPKPSQLQEILKLPLDNRVQALGHLGPRAWRDLENLAFSSGESLKDRWFAVVTLSRLEGDAGAKVVKKAAISSEWFMRNAAAVSLPNVNSELAHDLAKRLLSDPAMVVRTATVQSLIKMNATDLEDFLWKKLDAPENFHRGESLFIRRHIARALSEFSRPGNEAQWIRVLKDKDSRLYPFALQALNRHSKSRRVGAKESLVAQRAKWLSWWGDSSVRSH